MTDETPQEPLEPHEYEAWMSWRLAQLKEYGQWEAVAQIYADGALAYDIGHRVPASNVERHGYDKEGLVRRVGEHPKAPEKKGKTQDG